MVPFVEPKTTNRVGHYASCLNFRDATPPPLALQFFTFNLERTARPVVLSLSTFTSLDKYTNRWPLHCRLRFWRRVGHTASICRQIAISLRKQTLNCVRRLVEMRSRTLYVAFTFHIVSVSFFASRVCFLSFRHRTTVQRYVIAADTPAASSPVDVMRARPATTDHESNLP